MTTQQVFCGDNIELLKRYPDNHFDSIVTDAPYGLGKEPNAVELMKDWVDKGYHEINGSGFMGKEWDAFVPQPLFWKEAFRVLKHGGHVLSFFGTRTYDWGVMAMRFAGFEVRDTITWHYGSGFPKSHNISKALDKIEGTFGDENGFDHSKRITLQGLAAKKWDGWGSAIKPASEPIVLARKPLEKGLSIAENVLKWGTGGINIDVCRIGSESRTVPVFSKDEKKDNTSFTLNSTIQHERVATTQGRFPANVIFSHHEDCVCNGTKEVKAIKGGNSRAIQKNTYNDFGKNYDNTPDGIGYGFGDANGNETVENWFCVDGCPIKELDQQSGVTKSGERTKNYESKNKSNSLGAFNVFTSRCNASQGTASRFFYTAKSSKGERNKGLEEFDSKQMAWSNQAKAELKRGNTKFADETKMHNKVQERVNFHPTVKPIKLMQYLVRLITPPNGIVLDPFNGSGTTGIAAKLEGLNYVGLELDAEYCKISEARIAAWESETPETKKDNQLNLF